jgi:DNA-binding GntR family transcriptional regulator
MTDNLIEAEPCMASPGQARASGARGDWVAAEENELIRVCALVTRVACPRMSPRHLEVLRDSVERASCLPTGFEFDWDRKAAAHAEIISLLAATAADTGLPVLVRGAPAHLHDLMIAVGPVASGIIAGSRRRLLALLQAGDAEGAAAEMGQHLGGLLWMRRVFRGQG